MPIQSDEQARALATVISCLRPDWTPQGFYAVLRAEHAAGNPLLRRPFVDILSAAQAKAVETNPDGSYRAKTPKVVFMDGAHWATPTAASSAPSSYVPPEDRCPDHETETHADKCPGCWADYRAGDRPREYIGLPYKVPTTLDTAFQKETP